MALIRQGCRVDVLCPRDHPLTQVSGVRRIHSYHGTRSLECLESALREPGLDTVIPGDDGVVAQLHAVHAAQPALRPLIEASLGDPRGYPVTGNRLRLLELAAELGILIPDTRRVLATDDLVHWHEQVAPAAVLKIDGECGGNGVRICSSLEESLAAYRELTAPPSLATAWKRLIVNADPLALWAHRNRRPPEVSIQQLIRGRPANAMLACRGGELLLVVCVAVLATDGLTGASTVVQRIDHKPMEQAAKLLASRLRLTGFYGLDFMIDTVTQSAYLIEMNPRCTQLGHLKFGDRPSPAAAFVAAWSGERTCAAERALPLDTIGLFPQALNAAGAGARASASAGGSYLDVPWDEPALLAELMKASRPERRLAARIYHAVKPAGRTECVDYGEFPGIEALRPRPVALAMATPSAAMSGAAEPS
jgi:hypothetical protein